jgi:hypothetical protein
MKIQNVTKTNHQSWWESTIHLRDHKRRPTPEEKHLPPMPGWLPTLLWAVCCFNDPEHSCWKGGRNRQLTELISDEGSSLCKTQTNHSAPFGVNDPPRRSSCMVELIGQTAHKTLYRVPGKTYAVHIGHQCCELRLTCLDHLSLPEVGNLYVEFTATVTNSGTMVPI